MSEDTATAITWIMIVVFAAGLAGFIAYAAGYDNAIQDVMSGKVHPTAAATRWVVEQPEKQQ